MKQISIEKLTINIGCGADKSPEKAKELLEKLTGRKAVITRTHKRTTFGVAKNRAIGAKVTIRKNPEELLKRLLKAKKNKLKASNFDEHGNFAFGIEEYILIDGMRYDPDWGIMGMDVCVTLQRPGYRVKKRRIKSKIGKKHMITKQEAIEFARATFGVEVE